MPPVSTSSPRCISSSESASAFARTCVWYSRNALGGGDPEAGRLRGDRVHERAALHAGEDGPVDRLGVLFAAEDEAGARAGERLVGRRGDDVAVLDRVRM